MNSLPLRMRNCRAAYTRDTLPANSAKHLARSQRSYIVVPELARVRPRLPQETLQVKFGEAAVWVILFRPLT